MSALRESGRAARVLIGALAALALGAAPSAAQIVRAFTPRFSTNDTGDIALIGNTLMSCAGGAACTSARAGTGGSLNDNDFSMTWVDVDADAATVNSSSATLALPAGVTVLWAGLYWSGDSNSGSRNQALFSTPVAGYATLTATQLDASGTVYQGYVDVTARVQAGGNGTYTVGGVASTTGTNRFAGWGLVVAYRNPADPPRNLVVFDGYGQVAPGATQVFSVSGFLTPPAGAITTRLGVIAGEGDRGFVGDAFQLNGTALGDAVNPTDNFFNSTVSRLGTHVTAKDPNYQNQLGWDVDLVSANGVLPNGATGATITLSSVGDRYYPGVVTFATDLYQPILSGDSFTKSATDLNGAPTRPGETLEYLLTLNNTGNDAAVGVVVSDTLPPNVVFQPGSIEVMSGPNLGAKSDAPGDDQAEYDSATRRVIARLGTGATAAAGGRIAPAAATSVRFRATVAVPAPDGSVVSNQALASFNGEQIGTPFLTASDGDPGTAGIQRTETVIAAPVLSGIVFEDPDFGGGAGRALAAGPGVPRPGARVELYDSIGAFLEADTTDAAGLYAFSGWVPGTYTVRVVSGTVTSSRPGAVAGLLPVQTFRAVAGSGSAAPDPDRVGGEIPSLGDAPANTTGLALPALTTATATAQSVSPVALGTADLAGVDFGFNFDTIVNANDAGQGSLRQFIVNANALGNAGLAQAGQAAGIEAAIFMISDGLAHPGLRAGLPGLLTAGVARIPLATALPPITGAATRVDGASQTLRVGDTNPAVLGAGGVTGTDGLALPPLAGPEVELRDAGGVRVGLALEAPGLEVASLALVGFGDAPGSDLDAGIRVGAAAANATIFRCVLGTPAASFADPGAALRAGGDQVRVLGADDGQVRECLIGFAAGTGVALVQGANGWLVESCEIRGNAVGAGGEDGIAIAAGGGATVRGNRVADQEGSGIDAGASSGGNTIENNTVSGNGRRAGAGTAGVRLGGAGNLLDRNRLENNYGAGAMVDAAAAANRITRNSMSGNGSVPALGGGPASGQVGIDLLGPADDPATGTAPFVTLNDAGDADAGANGLLNFPVLQTAALAGGSLTVTGWARPGSVIELFVAAPDPSGFGEGATYLVSLTEGSAADLDPTTGAYGGPVNGLDQGADNTGRFAFTIALPPGVTGGTRLTATATLANATSEFSGMVTVGGSVAVSGWVYDDRDHNAQRGVGEPGTGASLWAKLVDDAAPGTALGVTAVDPLTGAWVFNFVPPASYSIVLDDNALATDVAPSRPPGWLGTENAGGTIAVVVGVSELADLGFGLWHGSLAAGRVFRDDGAGGGAANDGVPQPGEAGVAGVRVRALAAACPGGVCDSALADASGAWTLWVPDAASGSVVRLAETNAAGWLSTGGTAGTTAGTYDRAADELSYTPASGESHAGIGFADVPPSTWAPDGSRTVFAGVPAFYPHTFAAGTAGTLTLSAAQLPGPAIPGWSVTLIRDLDCDGAAGPGEPVIAAPIALAAGQSLCVVARHDSPSGAPAGAGEQITITAGFSLDGAAPPLATSAAVVDLTTVGSAGGLQLTKDADLAAARPGDLITYTITYVNPGPEPLSSIEIHDATPSYTVFDAGACGSLGAGLTGCALTLAPAPGTAGPVRWTLGGTLAPGASGSVSFRVRVL